MNKACEACRTKISGESECWKNFVRRQVQKNVCRTCVSAYFKECPRGFWETRVHTKKKKESTTREGLMNRVMCYSCVFYEQFCDCSSRSGETSWYLLMAARKDNFHCVESARIFYPMSEISVSLTRPLHHSWVNSWMDYREIKTSVHENHTVTHVVNSCQEALRVGMATVAKKRFP